VLGDVVVVGHHEDRHPVELTELLEEGEHLLAGRRVQRPGRLVSEQQARLVRERAGDRDPLTLSTGEDGGPSRASAREADLAEQLGGPPLAFGTRSAPEHRHLDVLGRGEGRKQVRELEDEADRLGAVCGGIVEVFEAAPTDRDRPGVWPVERADQVQEGALARARGAGERDQLARVDRERDVPERRRPSALEGLANTVELDRDAAVVIGVSVA
jgi:hypothetical protein